MSMTSSALLETGTEMRSYHLVEVLEVALDDGLYSSNSTRVTLIKDTSDTSSALLRSRQ